MGIFRRIFGGGGKKKNQPPSSPGGTTSHPDNKRRWSFARSSNTATNKNNNNNKRADAGGATQMYDDSLDANKHAIAVAAATAAVAEAALAAAHAAAEVVRLTSAGAATAAAGGAGAVSAGGRSAAHPPQPPRVGGSQRRWAEESAAVKIQSAFRGYLARRALRALKALVKLQALVRGHIVRKQTADMLRRMQTLVRLQARARASRSSTPESWHSFGRSSHSRLAVPAASPHKDQPFRACSAKFDGPSVLKRCGSHANFRDTIDVEKARIGSNWLDRWMEESLWNNHGSTPLRGRHADDEKSDKILEVDTWKPHMKSQLSNRTLSQHVLASDHINASFMTSDSPTKLSTRAPSVSSGEVLSYNSLKLPLDKDDSAYRTAENSPHVFCSSSRPGSSGRRGAFTPTRSEYSWNIFNGYSCYPNYMANTESSRAKVRSQSAPRLRLEFDRYGSSRRSTHGFSDADTRSERGYVQHTDFWNKAYPASGRLNRLGSSNLRS